MATKQPDITERLPKGKPVAVRACLVAERINVRYRPVQPGSRCCSVTARWCSSMSPTTSILIVFEVMLYGYELLSRL